MEKESFKKWHSCNKTRIAFCSVPTLSIKLWAQYNAYRIKPEELYILSCEKVEAEGRGIFHS